MKSRHVGQDGERFLSSVKLLTPHLVRWHGFLIPTYSHRDFLSPGNRYPISKRLVGWVSTCRTPLDNQKKKLIEELKIISGKDQIRYRGDRGSRTRLWFSLFSVLFVFVLIRNSWCSLHPHTYDQLLFPSPWAYVSLLSPFFVCLFLVYSHKKKFLVYSLKWDVFGSLQKMKQIWISMSM